MKLKKLVRFIETVALVGVSIHSVELLPITGTLIGFNLYVYPENFSWMRKEKWRILRAAAAEYFIDRFILGLAISLGILTAFFIFDVFVQMITFAADLISGLL